MKKGFCKRITSVILATVFCAGATALASPNTSDERQKKEPVQIVVVEKIGRDGRAVVANDKSRVPQVKGTDTKKDANQ